jgi:hypothetical protein
MMNKQIVFRPYNLSSPENMVTSFTIANVQFIDNDFEKDIDFWRPGIPLNWNARVELNNSEIIQQCNLLKSDNCKILISLISRGTGRTFSLMNDIDIFSNEKIFKLVGKIPDEEVAGDLYEVTQDILEAEGMRAYEVSNHARDGKESQHNLTYWRYTDYVGIGPGAHGRVTMDGKKHATRGHRAPEIWLSQALEQGHGAHPFEELTPRDRFTECLMMGLRLEEGIPVSRLEEEGAKKFTNLIDAKKIMCTS